MHSSNSDVLHAALRENKTNNPMCSTILMLTLSWLSLSIHALTLRETRQETLLFHHYLVPGDTFKTLYIHSLELTPVWEYFRISDQYEILLTDTIYQSSGAGLPIPEYGKDQFIQEGDRFHIMNINRHLPSIFLRTDPAYRNTFFFNDRFRLNLAERVGKAVIHIEIRREGLPVFLWRELMQYFKTFAKSPGQILQDVL